MRRIRTLMILAYWTAVFSLLAVAVTVEAAGQAALALLAPAGGLAPGLGEIAQRGMMVGAAFGFTMTATLFCWLLLTALLDAQAVERQARELGRTAFGAAALVFAGLVAVGLAFAHPGLIGPAVLHLLLLAGSWRLLGELGTSAAEQPQPKPLRRLTEAGLQRLLAAEAVHQSMLVRLAGQHPIHTRKAS